ncbi:MAG: hypothetical protein WKF34_00435 [Pyrinomonadaceae bacterium]
MLISSPLQQLRVSALLACVGFIVGCGGDIFQKKPEAAPSVGSVAAVRLNFRYEPDVPAPSLDASRVVQEINPAVQSDFDANRTFELLERTIPSPDKKQVVAVYRHISDISAEYRLDMYSPDGRLQRKMTSDAMAVHFPDTIVWSPNSASLAFVAMTRAALSFAASSPGTSVTVTPTPFQETVIDAVPEGEATPTPTPAPVPTPAAPTGILTFRSEQIYLANADGAGVKPVTSNEGIIYFYYVWSPDSSMLVALAATASEWRYREVMSESKGEMMVPVGRLRTIEKNGRERRLDDNQTAVRPVWSPDSTKVAAAFENQVRIYDATGTNPTQAAIPLRNQLLISSQIYDREQQRAGQSIDPNSNIPAPVPDQPLSTLPDVSSLVSFNPIVEIAWTGEDLIYLQTAYLRRMKNEIDNVRSFSRWHRLALTVQPAATPKQ